MFNVPDDKMHNDIWSHVYISDEYGIEKVADHIDVFIDLGANIGCASKKAIDCGIKKIICVECNKDTFKILKENMEDYQKENEIELLNAFATGRNFAFNSNSNNFNKKMQIIEDLIEKHSDERIFLKIDIEGGEYFVLKSMSDNDKINIPKYIRGEFHGFSFDHELNDIKIKTNKDVFDFFNSLNRKFIFPDYEKIFNYVLGSFAEG